MGIAGIPRYPRVYRGSGVEHGGNTVGMELDIAVTPRGHRGDGIRSNGVTAELVSAIAFLLRC